MKRVRFAIQKTTENFAMSDSECHSPRPFIETQMPTSAAEPCFDYPRVVPYTIDPVHRYECSNSSPYPSVNKTPTGFLVQDPNWKPSDDLDLSLLDASGYEPRKPVFNKSTLNSTLQNVCGNGKDNLELRKTQVLSSIENNAVLPPNILVKDNSFFIRRDNLDKYNSKPLHNQFDRLNICKENNPFIKKADIMKKGIFQEVPATACHVESPPYKPIIKKNYQIEPPKFMKTVTEDHCPCHHCVNTVKNLPRTLPFVHKEFYCDQALEQEKKQAIQNNPEHFYCYCAQQPKACSQYFECQPVLQNAHQSCKSPAPINAVDKKTHAVEEFEKRHKQSECLEIEKQTNVSKEKREPTVADLFKIIKLQNEQLQLLQDKVDKFITASQQSKPTISCSTEHVTISENDQMKMSIGVMTSFEMVRTSTIINNEFVKQNENQIQCNRSQISIKEMVSKPANLNFLDGIMHVNSPPNGDSNNVSNQVENGPDKTLNDLSLCNVQIGNVTTPNMSPEQTLYLDVQDYSESDASSNDQSNVGWTYYNKVMTHVNGVLQDSEMPSSASAMFRNMRQQCVQMQIDKSNISVTKRVKFGDDPLGIHQPHLYPSTDTSLKMNQLAAKYLNAPVSSPQRAAPRAPIDMSFATRNYMERHKLLQGIPSTSKSPHAKEIPRFLDITALKQQPKFL